MRLLLIFLAAACGREPRVSALPDLDSLARAVIPSVERAVGLQFRTPPVMAWRTRDAVTRYLERRLDEEYPPAEMAKVESSYRLFGFITDSMDLRSVLVELLSEQVVGYYDPDSTTLYVVEGAGIDVVRLTLGHELVHALQHQYVPLDSLLRRKGQNDAQIAFQAVMEGQATLASLLALLPAGQLDAIGDFWGDFRQQIRAAQNQMPVFRTAPLILREGLLFPYLGGADFARWFARMYPDTVPYGPRMPISTEQILHPDRYRVGDVPVGLAYQMDVWHQDDLGEFEIRLLLQELGASEMIAEAAARGWNGDRYAIAVGGSDTALVWWTVWDDATAHRRFLRRIEEGWRARHDGRGRRWEVREDTVGGFPAVVVVDAPAAWSGWATPMRPTAR